MRLNQAGTNALFSTYLGDGAAAGGTGANINPTNVAVASGGDIYVAGSNYGWLPQTFGSYQSAPGKDMFIAKIGLQSPCTFSISSSGGSFGVAAASTMVNVNTQAGCNWLAENSASWAAVDQQLGQGPGSVTISVAANPSPARNATLSIAGQMFPISQPYGCTFALPVTSQSFTASGTSTYGGTHASFAINTGPGCAFTPVVSADWITVWGWGVGNNGGGVAYDVAPYSGTGSRTGTITVMGQVFTVTQSGTPCQYVLSQTNITAPAGALSGSINVSAPATCGWTAASYTSWLGAGPNSGFGNGTVAYSAPPNGGETHTGTIRIAGQAVIVTQAGASRASALSVSPEVGTGLSQTFAARFSDGGGPGDISLAYLLVSNSVTPSDVCQIEYNNASHSFRVLSDDGTSWSLPIPAGTGSAANSQCTLEGAESNATASGNVLTVNFNVTFAAAYTGSMKIYLIGVDTSGQNNGWQRFGTFTVGSGGGTDGIPVCNSQGAPCVVSLTPSNGNGMSGTFTGIFTHTGGASQHYLAYILFLPTPNIVWYTATGSCLVEYNRISNAMRLINDAGTNWLPGLLGIPLTTKGTLANSHCTLDVTHSSAQIDGATMTVSAAVTFKSGFTGQLATFMQAFDVTGAYTGMTQFGNWMAAPSPSQKTGPYVVGVTPKSGTGGLTTLSFTAGHSSGVSSLSFVTLLISSVIVGAPACQVFYFPATNTLNMVNDAGTAMVSAIGMVPGSVGALVNSKCTIDTSGASRTIAGKNVTIVLPMGFLFGPLSGVKNVYVNAFDNYGFLSHWVTAGLWAP